MKLSKSTTILLNAVLMLLIVILLKSLITIPKDLYAQNNFKYKIIYYEDEISLTAMREGAVTWEERLTKFEAPINQLAEKGWRFHSDIKMSGYTLLVFER
jgi:hypothetical protein